jgi:hypothetical protein
MARTMGYIIAAVAVFEIQRERKAVAIITPRITRRVPTPIAATIP